MRRRGSAKYWVVGHNEGLLVARALALGGARVHLTIQDDVPDGMFRRSVRYAPFASLVRPLYERTLRMMTSIDVTSDGMQRYYRDRLGLSTTVVHPIVDSLPSAPATEPPNGEIIVGHLGSIYSTDEWRAFLRALRSVAGRRGLRPKMLMIGLAQKYRPAATEFGDMVEIVDDLPESVAVERLSGCHFLYAMYPFDARADVFRRTSLPTKVTTYLKVQRPIFAHSPAGSTLLDIVERYAIGLPCTSPADADAAQSIDACLALTVPTESYERTRREVYGIDNAERLRSCLNAL
jgi:hypothetical protein